MVKESPPHPTPSSQGISTTPYSLFQRSLHYTLPLFPRSLYYTLPPLPKESTPHPTPSSQGFHTTPCPLFLRSPQHTLRPFSWPNSLPHLPEIIPRFLLSVLSRPCWNFHRYVYIYFFSSFFFVRLAGSKCGCRGFQQALNYWIVPVNLRSNRINFI